MGSLSSYGVVALSNDLNHILRFHRSAEEQEGICRDLKRVLVECGGGGGVTECECMRRTHRNRDCDGNQSGTPHRRQIGMYFGYRESTEVAVQQILDKIHCVLVHSLETTTLTLSERTKLSKFENAKFQNGVMSTSPGMLPTHPTRSDALSVTSQSSRDRLLALNVSSLQRQRGRQQQRDEKLKIWNEIMAPKMEKLRAIRGAHRVKGVKFT